MSEQKGQWPIDPQYSDFAIWEYGKQLAYRHNELFDTIQVHKGFLQAACELSEGDEQQRHKKEERVTYHLSHLKLLEENGRVLSHAIGMLIGYEGLVAFSPYSYQDDDSPVPERPGYYFEGGHKVPLEP